MPQLIDFMWERDKDGYRLEELNPAYVELTSSGLGQTVIRATPVAPEWVRRAIEDRALDALTIENWSPWKRRFLVPCGGNVIRYNPLDEFPGLFMELYETATSFQGLTSFVSKFGLLQREELENSLRLGGTADSPLVRVANTNEIKNNFIHIGFLRRAVIAMEEGDQSGDYSQLIKLFHLEQTFGRDRSFSVGLRRSKIGGRPLLSFDPHDLIIGLWLQLAQTVSSNTQLRRCAWCSTWFSFGTGTGRRKSAHYCSDRCRKAFHRNEKKDKANER
jgi:hypothetical protein